MAATDKLRASLATACGLLGVAGVKAQATEVQSGVLGYHEPGRVSAVELLSDAKHEFAGGQVATIRLVYDALTGSSASGAVPALQKTQTFTSPSGNGSYTTEPGLTPLDNTFHDTRVAVSGGFSLPWGRLTTASLGLYGSFEHDYTSLGANASLAREFNRKNTMLTLRVARFEDTINPEGGVPMAMAAMPAPVPGGGHDDKFTFDKLAFNKRADDDEGSDAAKSVTDLGLGLTQVLGRRTVLNLNYTNSRVAGYQTDPYKIVSVVDGVTGAPAPVSGDPTRDLYLYESRPDNRVKNAVAAELIRSLGRDVVTLSYRYFDDDWGITSHTGELRYRLNFAKGRYFQPNVRWYHQTEADFYRRWLVEGETPDFVSADYRLGDMTAMTYGLKYGTTLKGGQELSLRVEYYAQSGDQPAGAFGDLAELDLFPTVDAWIVNVGYTFGK